MEIVEHGDQSRSNNRKARIVTVLENRLQKESSSESIEVNKRLNRLLHEEREQAFGVASEHARII